MYVGADHVVIGESGGSDDFHASDAGGNDSDLKINLSDPIVVTTNRVRSKNPNGSSESLPTQRPRG